MHSYSFKTQSILQTNEKFPLDNKNALCNILVGLVLEKDYEYILDRKDNIRKSVQKSKSKTITQQQKKKEANAICWSYIQKG